MASVRVRFAPSPTGFFHIGSARTALFNWLYARHTGGTFILRIEDTDKERNTPESLQVLVEGMRWLKMQWDEGPDAGGDYGPYFQSQRMAIYHDYLRQLREKDRVYEKDGAVYFKLLGERYTVYDDFKKREVEKVRNQPVVIEDLVRGRVERTEEQDFVIFRGNGEPVFHFVNVVDDIAMGITHVIRGEDHLSNTSKHLELYHAFGVPLPQFAHIPLILKSSGPGKMSKRDQGALIEEYIRRRFLPEAVRNYLCLLGWNPKDERELMPIEDIVALFDFPGINKDNARFDDKKLSHLNTEYLRRLPLSDYTHLTLPVLQQARLLPPEPLPPETAAFAGAVLGLCQEKIRAVEDLPGYVGYFFRDDFATDPKAREKVMAKGDPLARLRELRSALEEAADFSEPALEALISKLASDHGLYTGDYIHITRLALSGTNVGPSFYGLLRVLGPTRVRQRIDRFLTAT